ncbi:MAG: hypothetical protein FJ086_13295 [Deltaproteobacteria bacterium]|nr:hypothetical protein [Deltaproteobacteria bacterium]
MRERASKAVEVVLTVLACLLILGLAGALIGLFMTIPENPRATRACETHTGKRCMSCCVKNGARAASSGPFSCVCLQ